MAFRRATMLAAGFFDEKFKWYRTADIEYSFRVKDSTARATVVDLPVTKHEHRMWFNTEPRRPGEMVEEELLPVPRPVPRSLGSAVDPLPEDERPHHHRPRPRVGRRS